jgi:hypothetical protein
LNNFYNTLISFPRPARYLLIFERSRYDSCNKPNLRKSIPVYKHCSKALVKVGTSIIPIL